MTRFSGNCVPSIHSPFFLKTHKSTNHNKHYRWQGQFTCGDMFVSGDHSVMNTRVHYVNGPEIWLIIIDCSTDDWHTKEDVESWSLLWYVSHVSCATLLMSSSPLVAYMYTVPTCLYIVGNYAYQMLLSVSCELHWDWILQTRSCIGRLPFHIKNVSVEWDRDDDH